MISTFFSEKTLRVYKCTGISNSSNETAKSKIYKLQKKRNVYNEKVSLFKKRKENQYLS